MHAHFDPKPWLEWRAETLSPFSSPHASLTPSKSIASGCSFSQTRSTSSTPSAVATTAAIESADGVGDGSGEIEVAERGRERQVPGGEGGGLCRAHTYILLQHLEL